MTVFMHLTTARRRLNARALAILQTAVAALAAWYLCIALLPDEQPVFACIAAVIAIGASHGQHRQRATQLVLGVVTGLAVADVIIHFIGTGAPQLAIMVVLAMSVAVLFNGSELVISEAAVSAMLLVITGPSGDAAFSPNRILEGAIGGVVALAIALLFSPDPKLPVSRAAQAVFGRLGRALEGTAQALDDGDPARAEQALEQARSIEGLLRDLDAELATSRETVRTAPTRFGDREPIDRYDRSLEQIDFAVRNTRVLARHSLRALRARRGARRAARRRVRSRRLRVGAGRRPTTSPERADEARELASAAAVRATTVGLDAGLAYAEVAAPVRSTAVDLMRAAELVAGAPEELPTEELLLQPAPIEETGWVLTLA